MEESMISDKALVRRMRKYGIHEEDLEEHFIRSDGKGGQNVNKTSTAVYLKHRPTGIEVKCRMERSQGLNRIQARVILTNRIETALLTAQRKVREDREKTRRRESRRPASLKRKILRDKRFNSHKKKDRAWKLQDD